MNGLFAGLRPWLVQRFSGVYLAAYLAYAGIALFIAPPLTQADWRAWLSPLPMRLATLLFFLSLLAHTWIGMRDIILDYLPTAGLRLVMLSLLAGLLAVYAAWSAHILFVAL